MKTKNYKDETGKRFNMLVFLRFNSRKNKRTYWLCKCDCGNEKVIESSGVKDGKIKSCGCLKTNHEDLTGHIFHYWVVIKFDSMEKGKGRASKWLCECKCGKQKIVKWTALKSGKSKSCGCYKIEILKKREDFTGQKFGRMSCVVFNSIDKWGYQLWLCRCDCGTEKIINVSLLKNNIVISCGCFRDELSRKRTGKNHPNWNNGLTKDERLENKNRRYCPRNTKWRKKVMIRDNYTCQCCGQIGKYLQVHHIYSYHCHKGLRYVTSNGVTLCKNCHKEFHKIYTRNNNTRKQFKCFLRNYIYENPLIS